MKKKKTIEEEICEFIELWGCEKQCGLLDEIHEMYKLYDVDEKDDWVEQCVGEENRDNVRLIRTAYLLSRFSERYCHKLAEIKFKFPGLWTRIEREAERIAKEEECSASIS